MSSSPAYPTSVPLDGYMNGDHAAVDGSLTAHGEGVADVSPKGLFPQLIEVLHALIEGQELLACRLRDVRLEHMCHAAPDIERCPRAEPSAFVAGSFVARSPNGSIGLRPDPPTDAIDWGGGPTSANGSQNGSLPEPSPGVAAAPLSVAGPEASSPSNPPAAITTHGGTPADLSNGASARAEWLNSAAPGEAIMVSASRDYNFFDELDAKLADLQDQGDRPGDS